jgi:hypothetical protein
MKSSREARQAKRISRKNRKAASKFYKGITSADNENKPKIDRALGGHGRPGGNPSATAATPAKKRAKQKLFRAETTPSRPKTPALGRYDKKFIIASLNTRSIKTDREAKLSEFRQQMIQEDIDLLALQETKIILPSSDEGLRDFRLSDNTRCILSTVEAGLNGHGVSRGLGF